MAKESKDKISFGGQVLFWDGDQGDASFGVNKESVVVARHEDAFVLFGKMFMSSLGESNVKVIVHNYSFSSGVIQSMLKIGILVIALETDKIDFIFEQGPGTAIIVALDRSRLLVKGTKIINQPLAELELGLEKREKRQIEVSRPEEKWFDFQIADSDLKLVMGFWAKKEAEKKAVEKEEKQAAKQQEGDNGTNNS